MSAELRPARAGDVDALLAIENAVFRTDRLTRTSLRRLTGSRSAAVVVAESDGRVVGYCVVLFRSNSRAARCYSLAVDPGQSGRGIGRLLVAAAERETLARGRLSLGLEVRQDNRRAISIYRQSGFNTIGHYPGYYEDGATAIRMSKPLGKGMAMAAVVKRKETKRGGASFNALTEKTPRRASL